MFAKVIAEGLFVRSFPPRLSKSDRTRNGWKVFEAADVEPVFLKKDRAITYAQNRASFRAGEIRILDSTGNVESTVPFTLAKSK